jgi:uncharacterized protein YndB with AHSA1/START domain
MTASSTAAGRKMARELTLDAPIEVVWKALTDATELTRWFPLEARVTPGPGGAIWMKWDGDSYQAESPIEAWEPPHHLRMVFPLHDPVRLATDYYLESARGRTVLRVVTSGFGEGADWDDWFAAVGTGWDFELRSLKHYLERHREEDRVALSVRAKYSLGTDAAWNRLAGTGAWLSFMQPPAEGKRYTAHTALGNELTGVIAQWLPLRQVVLTVDQYNDAIWMATWGVPARQIQVLEQSWQKSIQQSLA